MVEVGFSRILHDHIPKVPFMFYNIDLREIKDQEGVWLWN